MEAWGTYRVPGSSISIFPEIQITLKASTEGHETLRRLALIVNRQPSSDQMNFILVLIII